MARSRIFASPALVGFEAIERMLEDLENISSDGYPPYNIERLSETEFSIALAVAGFGRNDLDVRVEGHRLVVSGDIQDDQQQERVFLHQGIAGRRFMRSFLLAAGFEVVRSWLTKGILHIAVACPVPDTKPRKIDIEIDG